MTSEPFGIYIQTYPGDFDLASVLIASIQQVSLEIPIMLIPGDDFDYENHPFEMPIMSAPGIFWSETGYMDRSSWTFRGPFETFLYLDANINCVKSLDRLAQRAVRQSGNFILVQPWIGEAEWQAALQTPSHPRHQDCLKKVVRDIGRGPLSEFVVCEEPGRVLAAAGYNFALLLRWFQALLRALIQEFLQVRQGGPGAMDQKCAKVLVASFADPQQPLLATG